MSRMTMTERKLEVDLPETETSIRLVDKKVIKLKKMKFYKKNIV